MRKNLTGLIDNMGGDMEKSIFDVNQMIGKLSEICLKEETLKSFVPKISFLKEKYQKAEVVTTIVGDFNSGKTSLCNFLLGKNALPTGSTPCTSTVYELRFSCEEEKASILNKLGEVVEAVSDLNQLKSKTFNPEQLITIESTSKALPQGIVVVDTPGLASDIEEHEKALMNYID